MMCENRKLSQSSTLLSGRMIIIKCWVNKRNEKRVLLVYFSQEDGVVTAGR